MEPVGFIRYTVNKSCDLCTLAVYQHPYIVSSCWPHCECVSIMQVTASKKKGSEKQKCSNFNANLICRPRDTPNPTNRDVEVDWGGGGNSELAQKAYGLDTRLASSEWVASCELTTIDPCLDLRLPVGLTLWLWLLVVPGGRGGPLWWGVSALSTGSRTLLLRPLSSCRQL